MPHIQEDTTNDNIHNCKSTPADVITFLGQSPHDCGSDRNRAELCIWRNWQTFVVNFIAVVPLYSLTDVAVVEIQMRMDRIISDFLVVSTRYVNTGYHLYP